MREGRRRLATPTLAAKSPVTAWPRGRLSRIGTATTARKAQGVTVEGSVIEKHPSGTRAFTATDDVTLSVSASSGVTPPQRARWEAVVACLDGGQTRTRRQHRFRQPTRRIAPPCRVTEAGSGYSHDVTFITKA